MNWLGIILAVTAIIVTLTKELDEGKKSEKVILHLSVAELTLAVLSIVISLSKHVIRHNSLVLLQKNIRVERNKDGGNNGSTKAEKTISNRRKLYFSLAAVLTAFVSVLLISFGVMHAKDDDTYQYLTYTKFTTTVTLFLSILLDSLINDFLTDAYNTARLDQCRLVIHQLKIEVKASAHEARYGELKSFLDNHEVFSLSNSAHIKYQDVRQMTEQQNNTEDSSNRNHGNNNQNVNAPLTTNDQRAYVRVPNHEETFTEML